MNKNVKENNIDKNALFGSFCDTKNMSNPLMIEYHNNRWCKAIHDEKELFAMLSLEGMQAGLSWDTIINKEKAFREAFDDFDIEKISKYGDNKIEELMQNKNIVRNRLKIKSVIKNSNAILNMKENSEYKTFNEYIWHFTNGKQIIHHYSSFDQMPAKDELSEKISKDLKKRGFSFVGPVIIYSYLQGIGIIDDHMDGCPCKCKG